MKKLLFVLALPLALVAALSIAVQTGGCGLLDSSAGITISLPSQEFDFELNANQARDQIEQAINDQLQGLTIDLTGETEIPQQVCDGASCVNVPTVQEDFTFDLPAQQVDLSDQADLKRYVEAGKVKEVKIKSISYDITSNSLNFDLPAMDLYMDALDSTEISASSDLVAVVPSIGAEVTGEGEVQFTTNGRQIMSNYLLGYAFAMLGRANYTLDTAVTRTIPQGQMIGKVKIGLEFTVDPI
jgi:hypothetical protein